MCMSELLDIALEKFGVNTVDDAMVDENVAMRQEMTRALLRGELDPKVATAAKGLLADNDKIVLVRNKLAQDSAIAQDQSELLQDVYRQLIKEKGKDFDLDPNAVIDVTPEQKELVANPDEVYTFEDHELISGDDTEDSML